MAPDQEKRASPLDPAALDKLSGLALVARTVVEGFRAGQHRSPRRGSSAEFAQHREYVPGDEPRRIDWKLFARQDRLVVKEYLEESNLDCHLLVDTSGSMGYRSLPWSKLDWARWCAAALAVLVIEKGDSAGLVLFRDGEQGKVPPSNGFEQQRRILTELEKATAEGPTAVGQALRWLGSRLRRRGIVAIFSDFLDEPAAVAEGLRLLAHAGHEPILFQVLDPQELEFDFGGHLRLEDLEGGARLRVSAKDLRTAYLEELARHTAELRAAVRALSLDHVQISTRTPMDVALSTYLARRAARARGRRV